MASEATLKMILLGVDRSASKMMRGVGNETQKTSGKFGQFAKVGKFAAAGVAAGLAAAGTAAIAFGRSSVHAYESVAKESALLARTTGVTIKQASQLRFAAQETGTEFDTLAKSMKFLAKNQTAASGQFSDFEKKVKDAAAQHKKFNGHLGTQATAFARLGVSIKGTNGQMLPMKKVLDQVANQFKKMPDGPEKTALAMKLFGKGGADMLKFLNQGSDGLKKFADEADKTGNSISNIDGYKKNIAAQREFHASITGLKIQLGQALYPALTAISESLATNVGPAITKMLPTVKKFGDWIQQHIVPAIKELADKYLKGMAQGFANLKPHLKDLQPYLNALATILTKVIMPVMGKMYSIVLPALGYALAGVAIGLGAVAKAAVWMWNNALQPVFKFFTEAIAKVLGGLSDMFGALGHVKGFGWAKNLAHDLRDAATAAGDVADSINKIPNHKAVKFSLQISAKDRWLLANPNASPILKSLITGHSAAGSHINQSGFYDVGEVGRERVFLPRGSTVQSTASMQREGAAGTSSSQPPITININGVGFDKRHVARELVAILKDAGVTSGGLVLA